MADTTISPSPREQSTGQKTASGIGGWIQKNKTAAIAIAIVVVVILFYFFYHNSQSQAAANNAANQSGYQGSTISPADLAGLLSSIPQGPAGPAGAQGPAGPPGKQGKPGKPGKNGGGKHHKHVPPSKNQKAVGVQTYAVPLQNRNVHYRAAPPVHATSQKAGR